MSKTCFPISPRAYLTCDLLFIVIVLNFSSQLHEVMDRIEGFPITAPVMKFLTGLELLLQTAQVSTHSIMFLNITD